MTTAPTPPTGAGLPPALPPGFDTPAPTTGGGATATPTVPTTTTPPATTPPATTPPATTPPATAATSTSFLPATNTIGGGFTQVPPPGGCTIPTAPPGKDLPPPGKDPVQGGGGTLPTEGLGPVLSQLTTVLGQLTTAVGGVSGGGAPGKTPEQTPPGKDPVQGGGAPATTPPAATPPASTVAGANGAGAANAAAGATQVQGGGATAPQDMSAIVAALQGLIEVLNKLVQALGGTIGGGPGKDVPPPPGKDVPPPSDVKGDHGKGDPTQTPIQAPPKGDVKGDKGPGTPEQKPEQKDPGQKPPVVPPPPVTPPPPPTQVGGEQGPGQTPGQVPTQTPTQVPPPPKTDVDGAKGGPKDTPPTPTQTPTQTPGQVPPPPKGNVVVKGNVILDNDDERWSAKLTAKGGKGGEDSVELWGDPHVVISVDGKAEKFDIGHGEGKVKLFDGTVITWDTYGKGQDHQFILRDFKINSPGTKFDRDVTTRDRNGDKGDEMNLTTALTDKHLAEFAAALRTMKGPMNEPLKNGTWTSPDYGKKPADPTQSGVVQQS